MKAIRCHAYDTDVSKLVLEEIERVEPKQGEVVIRVEACTAQFADTLIIAGRYQFRPELPFVPGMEMAGEVVTVGEGVDESLIGQRVMGVQYYGGFGEYAALLKSAIVAIPDSMPSTIAAAYPATYSTSYIALTERGRVQPGEWVLVLGASGGVGLAAVEIATALGAKVIAGVSTDEKAALAIKRGAVDAIIYSRDHIRGRVRKITEGHGVDVVIDPVGGALFKQAMRSMAWDGRIVIVGFASGEIPETSVNRLLIENTSLVGMEWGTYNRHRPDIVKASFEQLNAWWESGEIKPHVSEVYPLEETPQVLQKIIDRETTGRVVITME